MVIQYVPKEQVVIYFSLILLAHVLDDSWSQGQAVEWLYMVFWGKAARMRGISVCLEESETLRLALALSLPKWELEGLGASWSAMWPLIIVLTEHPPSKPSMPRARQTSAWRRSSR